MPFVAVRRSGSVYRGLFGHVRHSVDEEGNIHRSLLRYLVPPRTGARH